MLNLTSLIRPVNLIGLLWSLTVIPTVFAFPDLNEPNDSSKEATVLTINDPTRHQYTLHDNAGEFDVDWFKFYAQSKDFQGKPVIYDIAVSSVGEDIDVAIDLYATTDLKTPLRSKNNFSNGKGETLSWSAPADGIYYLKISDSAEPSDTCRIHIQYEVTITVLTAGEFPSSITGQVMDAVTGLPVEGVVMSVNCNTPSQLSGKDGKYNLLLNGNNCQPSEENQIMNLNLTAETTDQHYQSVTCQVPGVAGEIIKNIWLWPTDTALPLPFLPPTLLKGDTTVTISQEEYHSGDQLRIDGPADLSICGYYSLYLGLLYPDGSFKLITALNQLVALNIATENLQTSHRWQGIGSVVIDMPTDNWTAGNYTVYQLRMPSSVTEPLNHLEEGELKIASFKVMPN